MIYLRRVDEDGNAEYVQVAKSDFRFNHFHYALLAGKSNDAA